MMDTRISHWKNGVRDGAPICMGYFTVAFTFGIMAKNAGLTPFQAVLMSVTNLASAGQFAALGLIGASSGLLELALTQVVLNLRYCLMSCSLAQKFSEKTAFVHRLGIAHGVTDEIFGVSVCKDGKLNPYYNYGLMSIAIPGWALGTFFGVVSGGILPERIVSALGIALYSMFMAIIIPPAKDNKWLSMIIFLSMLMSLLFVKLAVFSQVSAGFRIIILTIVIAGLAARLFPLKEDCHE